MEPASFRPRPSVLPAASGAWLPIVNADLARINVIADRVHTDLPERPEVFAEKVGLSPEGCRKLVVAGETVGYGICHPWMLQEIPPLDEFLRGLPPEPDCLYIHDVVVLPEARGGAATSRFVTHVRALAATREIGALALVSVYGTDRFWTRFGFVVEEGGEALRAKVASYGPTACYMVART